MKFSSPWRSPLFVAGVASIRWLLRPLARAEAFFIQALVAAHNQRVSRHLARRKIGSVLLIMPRCLKRRGCRVDVRESMALCPDCTHTECPLRAVARLTTRFGVRALVAFRSHIAYEMARRERPDLLLATACEDRLIKALRSVPEIPALLTPLTGLERPCINAGLDLRWLTERLQAACAPDATLPTAIGARGGEKTARSAESL